MSNINCPYCDLKAHAKVKSVFSATDPLNGKCPDCGSYIDAGQHSVEINGYADIYKGAIRLIDGIVEEFNEILAYCDIDLSDYMNTEAGKIPLKRNATEIVEQLFVPYYGGTTKNNVVNALNLEEESHIWMISKEEAEDEW